ncbi:MAG: iron-sulfur cluster assembly scaffold protein [Desulfopila sp.]|jgi:NifU-like protein involved in Fe-S cluster formation|nr:iron-sulfur cluster assembly scaffold protein [Desulfopila sp.]
MTVTQIFILLLVLFCFIGAWYGLSYLLSPQMDDADGIARVTGNCGDTMEIGLQIRQGKVVKTHHWTDGCTMSRNCVEAAARLAYGKTAENLRLINMTHIVDDVGDIPDSHLHCAQLAEISLHKALENYFSKNNPAAQTDTTGGPEKSTGRT